MLNVLCGCGFVDGVDVVVIVVVVGSCGGLVSCSLLSHRPPNASPCAAWDSVGLPLDWPACRAWVMSWATSIVLAISLQEWEEYDRNKI